MPRLAKLRLEQIQRDFLWGEGGMEKKPYLVKWLDCLCEQKERRFRRYAFLCSIKPFYVSGFSILLMRNILFGERLSV